MARKKDMARTKIDVVEEPEIQYAATPELFAEIEEWLMKRGGRIKSDESDAALYYDTANFRLLREGIEYRTKEKGGMMRHDMKTPLNPRNREVMPDENGILWRNEMKCKTETAKPSLQMFFGQALLAPVSLRVREFFGKTLEAKFRSVFDKKKIDHDSECGRGRIEYSFQTGNMETVDKSRRTRLLHILELELRQGDMQALLDEKKELERIFVPKGLGLLAHRKLIMGFELLVPDMNDKQYHAFQDAKIRNSRDYAAELLNNAPLKTMAA